MNALDPTVVAAIGQVLEQASDFLCVGHQDADADSLGSLLAMCDALERTGKRTYPWVPAPVPRQLGFLPGYERVNQSEAPAHAVVLAFDAGSPGRFASLRERIDAAATVVVIDHHRSNQGFGTIALVDPDAAATGELLLRLLQALGLPVSPAAATNLYAALLTDTGGFRHDNTSASVLATAAELAQLGAEPGWVARMAYKSQPITTLRLHALVTASAWIESAGRLLWSEVTADLLAETGAQMEEAEGLIDILQSLDTLLVAVLLKQVGPARTKVSVRTRPGVEAHLLLAEFGGGGHARAAGADLPLPLEPARELVLRAARAAVAGAA
ncbi:MAG TPA: DHH family phosphoesterase [Verrucomicrobiae bacterium]|nr:DHH family phosphoesterase [Verrucomicrobiae bacterium]